MAKSSRYHTLNNSDPKNKRDFSEINLLLEDPQEVDLTPTDIIIVNTDDKIPPQVGAGMITTRTNRMIASMSAQSELVSIAVQSYNQLEKVKICVECILKYSTNIDFELLLFDNGSTDGTLDYFKSIQYPRKKIIRVTKNVGSIVNFVFNHFSGRYLAYVMGDVCVTKNWLTNLLTCLKSDETIGMVSPVASNVSYQGADISFSTLEEMHTKAAIHNISDPSLWNERLTLFPAVGLYRREALELGGMLDAGFFHYLVDNDFSFRIRRAGYKLILCKDTFIHHNHDRSDPKEKDPEEARRSLEAGRRDFQNKFFGVDAWDDVNNFEPVIMSMIDPQEHKGNNIVEILGVDVLCGTPILEAKNKLREAHVNDARLSAFTTKAKYWLDLKTICSEEVAVDQIQFLNQHFTDKRFDYVVLGIPINAYQDPLGLLQNLLKCLKDDGHLLLKLHNTFDILSLFKTLGAKINVNVDHVYRLSMDALIDHVKNAGFIHNKLAVENWSIGEQDQTFLRKAITTTGFSQNPDEVFARALVRDYVVDIAR